MSILGFSFVLYSKWAFMAGNGRVGLCAPPGRPGRFPVRVVGESSLSSWLIPIRSLTSPLRAFSVSLSFSLLHPHPEELTPSPVLYSIFVDKLRDPFPSLIFTATPTRSLQFQIRSVFWSNSEGCRGTRRQGSRWEFNLGIRTARSILYARNPRTSFRCSGIIPPRNSARSASGFRGWFRCSYWEILRSSWSPCTWTIVLADPIPASRDILGDSPFSRSKKILCWVRLLRRKFLFLFFEFC